MYDLIIIGGGPGGYTAAERAGKAGLKTLIIEKQTLGGVCLNEGCIPSKTLLNSAKVLDYARDGAAYGVKTDGAVFDHAVAVARKNKVVKKLVQGVKALVRASGAEVVYGHAQIQDKYRVRAGEEVYEGERLLIATGSEPIIPPIPGLMEGLESGFALTNREILNLAEIPERLAIIGGGIIGLEMASYYNSAGSKVTVIEMMPKIAGQADAEISKALMETYSKRGVKFILNSAVTGISQGKVVYEGYGTGYNGVEPADSVLLSMGRKPICDGFGLENIGVAVNMGAITTDLHMQSSVSGVYAVGDVNGKYMLAHAAYREAEVAINHMLGIVDAMRYDAIPSVIYTAPEAAGVGETEESAATKGLEVDTVTVPISFSGRYVAENASAPVGFCKVIVGTKDRRIVGVHILGTYASEIIASACIMIEMKMTVNDVRQIVFPHPSVNEIIREAVYRV